MKKLLIVAVAMIIVSFSACGLKHKPVECACDSDSIPVDTLLVDTVIVDSVE